MNDSDFRGHLEKMPKAVLIDFILKRSHPAVRSVRDLYFQRWSYLADLLAAKRQVILDELAKLDGGTGPSAWAAIERLHARFDSTMREQRCLDEAYDDLERIRRGEL